MGGGGLVCLSVDLVGLFMFMYICVFMSGRGCHRPAGCDDVPCLATLSPPNTYTHTHTHTQNQEYYEVEVELLTGRTHQLRATFAAEGAPIVHDTMYVWHVWMYGWELGRLRSITSKKL